MKLTAHHIVNRQRNEAQKGFTLIELLVVIGILAILLAITLIAINPARQFGNANNTARRSAATQILNAIGQNMAENNGQLHASLLAVVVNTPTELNNANFPGLCAALVPNYIPALPTNPTLNAPEIAAANCGTYTATGYSITRDANNRITVAALTTDNNTVIQVTR